MSAASTNIYRLLLLDLEGTLLSSKGDIHKINVQKLGQLMQGGMRLSFLARQGPRSYGSVFEQLLPNAPVIHFDGGLIRDAASGEVLLRHTLSLEDALTSLAVADFMGLQACMFVDDQAYASQQPASLDALEALTGGSIEVVGDLVDHLESLGREPIKLLFVGQPESFGTFADEVRRSARSEPLVRSLSAGTLEVRPGTVSRVEAAGELVEVLGLQLDDVIVFGDDLDDIELLNECGIGVAVSNGHPELLSAADVIIDNHDTDAIAFYLDGEFYLEKGTLIARR